MNLRQLLVGVIVVATVVFGIAVTFERSDADVHPSGTTSSGESGGETTHSGEGEAGESAGSSGSSTDEGTILGVDPESSPIIVLVVTASLCLAAVIWLRPDWRWLLVITAIGMLIFAVLDVRELVHQFAEARTGLGISALLVAALHVSAASIALLLLRQPHEISVGR
jgi:hypothetical protein